MIYDKIIMDHGSGGLLSNQLINNIFIKHFGVNSKDNNLRDSATLPEFKSNTYPAFTTDSFVISPLFFPGADIGKLAVCGTVNDLSVSGAVPLYLSAGFIIEEGFLIKDLETIVISMSKEAEKSHVRIVTGDTKIVEKGSCDGLFINTAGIGSINNNHMHIAGGEKIKPGDKIIINGSIAEHGMAVMGRRNNLPFTTPIESDCACLNKLIHSILKTPFDPNNVKFMRDATRGGIATVLCEIVQNRNFGINLYEDCIPIKDPVLGYCELLGFDPLYVANEGKAIFICSEKTAESVINKLRENPFGKE